MHSYKILHTAAEWEPFRLASKADYERWGGQWPNEGQAVMFAEYDDEGQPLAFQFLQTGVFAEGLWARDGRARLRQLWRMMVGYLEHSGQHGTLFTMVRGDGQGERLGRAGRVVGFADTNYKVLRREF